MTVSTYRRGATWWIRYRQHGRLVRRSLGTRNKKIADELRLQTEWGLRHGELPAKREPLLLAPFLTEWEARSLATKRPKSHRTDMARLRRYLDWAGHERVEELTSATVQSFLAHLALERGASQTTLLRDREVLRAFCAEAVRRDAFPKNPVDDVPRPRPPQRDPRFLSLEQIEELLGAVTGDPVAPVVATIVYAGLRRSEACWPTWKDLELDPAQPLLWVCSKTVGDEAWWPKTRRNRTVPLSQRLRGVLADLHLRREPGVPWAFPSPCRAPTDVRRELAGGQPHEPSVATLASLEVSTGGRCWRPARASASPRPAATPTTRSRT